MSRVLAMAAHRLSPVNRSFTGSSGGELPTSPGTAPGSCVTLQKAAASPSEGSFSWKVQMQKTLSELLPVPWLTALRSAENQWLKAEFKAG